jgi:bifunctional polynucleotide phosphatase/kinase
MLTVSSLCFTARNPIFSHPITLSQTSNSPLLFLKRFSLFCLQNPKRFSFFCFQKSPMPPPPPHSSHVVAEYAKSDRSSCKGCAKTIVKKALRVGIVSRDARGFDMTKWHHLECFPVGTASIGSAETIKGFEALQVWLDFVN